MEKSPAYEKNTGLHRENGELRRINRGLADHRLHLEIAHSKSRFTKPTLAKYSSDDSTSDSDSDVMPALADLTDGTEQRFI